jgi:hypothetical protein
VAKQQDGAAVFVGEVDQRREGVGGSGGRLAVGERSAGAEAGAEIEGDERLAEVGIAVENDELAGGEDIGPEPADGFIDDAIAGGDGHDRGAKVCRRVPPRVTSCAREVA